MLPISRSLARRSLLRPVRPSKLQRPIVRSFTSQQPRCLQHVRGTAQDRYGAEENGLGRDRPKEQFNPYDTIGNHRRDMMYIAKTKREIYFLFVGLIGVVGATYLMTVMFPADDPTALPLKKKPDGTHSADASQADNEAFQGRPVVVAAGGQKLVVEDPTTHKQVELVPTGTSYVPHFPKTITIPSSNPNEKPSEYTLIGLGIRRVSFLSVQVYIVGLYVKTTSLAPLQASLVHHINPIASALIPGEKESLQSSLLDPVDSQRIWESVLQDKGGDIETALRVVPVRDTNFNHLRDGWVTGLNNKMQEAATLRQKKLQEAGGASASAAAAAGQLTGPSEFENDSMAVSMRSFKNLFQGRGKAPKGSIILLTRDSAGNLDALFQKDPAGGQLEHVGKVDDERISRLIWLLYLGGKNVSSEDARKDVVKGVMAMVERPVGTVETQVV